MAEKRVLAYEAAAAPEAGLDALDKAWASACKTVLGGEIGGLRDYAPWLREHMDPFAIRRSTRSGDEVRLAVPYYPDYGRFITHDEAGTPSRPARQLSINEIKDIDSIIEALSERFEYCGNIVLGNSRDVRQSSNVQNSSHILESNFVSDSEYLAYCSNARRSRHSFGLKTDADSSFIIRGFEGYKNTRCFEEWLCLVCSDCHFSFGLRNCQEAMFSFNLENARHTIGNLALPRDEYLKLKSKLMDDARGELEAKKALPSLMDMISAREPEPPRISVKCADYNASADLAPIDRAFACTSRALLGRELGGVEGYSKWLSAYIPEVQDLKSISSGLPLMRATHTPYRFFPKERLMKEEETKEAARMLVLSKDEMGSMDSVLAALPRIGYIWSEGRLGENRNVTGTPLANTSLNCHKGPVFSYNKDSAYCYWSRESSNMFGCALAHASSSCISVHQSQGVSRGFESDGCSSCSDIYFSHNCENVVDGMFCFNAKGLRNAIGNCPLPRDVYGKAKEALTEQMADELIGWKRLRWSIYSIGGHVK